MIAGVRATAPGRRNFSSPNAVDVLTRRNRMSMPAITLASLLLLGCQSQPEEQTMEIDLNAIEVEGLQRRVGDLEQRARQTDRSIADLRVVVREFAHLAAQSSRKADKAGQDVAKEERRELMRDVTRSSDPE